MSYDAEQLWQLFTDKHPEAKDAVHQAWSFGGGSEQADIEAMKVVSGLKQATTNLTAMYAHDDQEIPTANKNYEILYDGSVHAVAILQYVAVQAMPFSLITAEHAYLEGLDDRTLKAWQTIQQSRFATQSDAIGEHFSGQTSVIALTFKVVFTPPTQI